MYINTIVSSGWGTANNVQSLSEKSAARLMNCNGLQYSNLLERS